MPLARVSGKLFDALVDHEDGVPLLPVCVWKPGYE